MNIEIVKEMKKYMNILMNDCPFEHGLTKDSKCHFTDSDRGFEDCIHCWNNELLNKIAQEEDK